MTVGTHCVCPLSTLFHTIDFINILDTRSVSLHAAYSPQNKKCGENSPHFVLWVKGELPLVTNAYAATYVTAAVSVTLKFQDKFAVV